MADPTTLAFALEQQLDHLAELELEGEEVSAREEVLLYCRYLEALDAEADLDVGERF